MSDLRERWGSPGIVIHTITLFSILLMGWPNLPLRWFCPGAVEAEAEHVD
ncbi:hypothetical protein [Rhodococcus sp. USK13]|nr:hypothetical protein [Rhodococcus sp. USK13]